jgi:galactokinase
MALDREIAFRFQPRTDRRVILRNTDSRFSPVDFTLDHDISPDPAGAWGNYPRAAAQALWRETGPLTGLEGEISSTLPIASGLSSSSALVVATALALLDRAGRTVPAARLMELLARGERYVGLQGGGMDQAVSLGGRAGHAIRIDFRPELRLTAVPVPPDWRIIVASSMVEAAKSAGARDAYNTRVRECRKALELVATHGLGVEPPADYQALLKRLPASDAIAVAGTVLDGELLRRFRHVVTEADRVDQAVATLTAGDLAGFGRLLHASHASLRNDYEVSSPELDELVTIAEGAGAAGARLTGAGFGGCILAVAATEAVRSVMDALAREYYAPRGVTNPSHVLFIAAPSEGARVDPG